MLFKPAFSAAATALNANEYFKTGMEEYLNGNYHSALDNFIETLKTDPLHTGAKYYIKESNERIAEGRMAEENLRKKQDKEEDKLKKKQEYLNKVEARRKIMEEKSRKKERLETAINHYEKGELIIAREKFETILMLEPENQEAGEWLKKTKDAINKMMSKKVEELFVEGQMYYEGKKYEAAIEAWEKALKINPEHGVAKERLWMAKKKLEETGGGEEKVEQGEKENNIIEEHYKTGIKNLSDKKYSEAITDFKKVLELSPGYKKAGSYYNTAASRLEKEQKTNEAKADRYYNLGLKQYKAKNLDMAIDLWEEALKLYPAHPKASVALKRAIKERK
ncbi:MAG: tetratricopeptide repeat protein [bacterium]